MSLDSGWGWGWCWDKDFAEELSFQGLGWKEKEGMLISVDVGVFLESSSSSHLGGVQALCLNAMDESGEALGAQVPCDVFLRNGIKLMLSPKKPRAACERCSPGYKLWAKDWGKGTKSNPRMQEKVGTAIAATSPSCTSEECFPLLQLKTKQWSELGCGFKNHLSPDIEGDVDGKCSQKRKMLWAGCGLF